MPRTVFLVVCGTGDTMDTLAPQSAFSKVDFPDEGRPTIATKADLDMASPELIYTFRSQ
jgi:hypothetical protein